MLNEEVLQDTFDRMDHDDSGVISRENLRSLLRSRASDELVETLMQEGDLKRNGHVDYEERLVMRPAFLGLFTLLGTWRRCSQGVFVFYWGGALGAACTGWCGCRRLRPRAASFAVAWRLGPGVSGWFRGGWARDVA